MLETIKSWFKRTPKIPVELPRNVSIIQEFTTRTEPKVADYPVGEYKAYWEIVLGEVAGGYSATVRFYNFADGSFISQETFVAPNVKKLKPEVNKFIVTTMKQFKR